MPDHDVIVVGGGPAGASTAITCARNSLNTLLVERGGRRRHKPCGGILPNVCAELITEHFGIEIPDEAFSGPRASASSTSPPAAE